MRAAAMNKNDLIAHVADAAGISKGDAGKVVDAVFVAVTVALKKGEDASVYGFGNFSVAARAARVGRNPKTGVEIVIPASKAPKFTASKSLKEAVNG